MMFLLMPALLLLPLVATEFVEQQGAITAGGDLLKANLTVSEAKSKCASLDGCVGFTFSTGGKPPAPANKYSVYLKSITAANSNSNWSSFLKVPSNTRLRVDATKSHDVNKLIMGCHSDSGYTHQPRAFYSQMVVGASFDGVTLVGSGRPKAEDLSVSMGPKQKVYWNCGQCTLDDSVKFHNHTTLKIVPDKGGNATNRGLGNEGLVFEAGKAYEGYVFVRAAVPTRLVLALHDYVSANVLASSSHALDGRGWQRVNFTLTPSASTTCSAMTRTDRDGGVDCTDTHSAQVRDHICVKCGGEFVIGAVAGGAVSVGYVFLSPGKWARLGDLPVLASTVKALQKMGVTAIRQGGSFTDPSYYLWKRWTGPRWRRPSLSASWGSSYEAGWGPFEMIEMCEQAGFEPIITTTGQSGPSRDPALPGCCSPEDMADLIEYAWGNASTEWGRKRIADGRIKPYPLRYIELGNEQYNSLFVDQVKAMEARAAKIGKQDFFYYIFPDNGGLNASDVHRAQLLGLDASRLAADLHVGYGGAVEGAALLFETTGNKAAVNLETNAGTHHLQRALGEAQDLNDFLNSKDARLKVRTASFCTERSGHFDAFDQGLVFFLPNQTWLQPPAHVHAMVKDTWQEKGLSVSYASGLGQSASAQMAADGSKLVVRYVNQWNTSVEVQLDFSGFSPSSAVPKVQQMKPPARASEVCGPQCPGPYYFSKQAPIEMCCSNPPSDPDLLVPTMGAMKTPTSFVASPFSYTIVEFERSDSSERAWLV